LFRNVGTKKTQGQQVKISENSEEASRSKVQSGIISLLFGMQLLSDYCGFGLYGPMNPGSPATGHWQARGRNHAFSCTDQSFPFGVNPYRSNSFSISVKKMKRIDEE
jgi:hypothetical protein